MHVQTLVAKSPIKRFNEGIFHGFAWANEVKLHATAIGPVFQGPRLEFRPMINADGAWAWSVLKDPIQHISPDIRNPASTTGLEAAPSIHHGQNPIGPSLTQRVLPKIPAPTLRRPSWPRGWASMQRDRLPSPHPRRNWSPSTQYHRRTRLRLTAQPSRRSNTQMRT